MLGKTHMIIGIAASLVVTQPVNIPEMILAIGGGALGALISDIDVRTSIIRHKADKIIVFSALTVLAVIVLDQLFHIGLMNKVVESNSYRKMIAGVILFIAVCAFGKEQPHRSFMHSFLAMLLLCLAISLVWKKAVIYFAVGFLSHLAIDIFNKSRVQLFYPFHRGIALGLFHAQGLANSVFFAIGSAVAAMEIVLFVIKFINIQY